MLKPAHVCTDHKGEPPKHHSGQSQRMQARSTCPVGTWGRRALYGMCLAYTCALLEASVGGTSLARQRESCAAVTSSGAAKVIHTKSRVHMCCVASWKMSLQTPALHTKPCSCYCYLTPSAPDTTQSGILLPGTAPPLLPPTPHTPASVSHPEGVQCTKNNALGTCHSPEASHQAQ
jgi:hypothetical protein